jgi:hypothetical protein
MNHRVSRATKNPHQTLASGAGSGRKAQDHLRHWSNYPLASAGKSPISYWSASWREKSPYIPAAFAEFPSPPTAAIVPHVGCRPPAGQLRKPLFFKALCSIGVILMTRAEVRSSAPLRNKHTTARFESKKFLRTAWFFEWTFVSEQLLQGPFGSRNRAGFVDTGGRMAGRNQGVVGIISVEAVRQRAGSGPGDTGLRTGTGAGEGADAADRCMR